MEEINMENQKPINNRELYELIISRIYKLSPRK